MLSNFPGAVFVVSLLLSNVLGADTTTPLKIVKTQRTPNGFTSSARGWNSFGLQANSAINPSFSFDQNHIIAQVDALASIIPLDADDYYISLDSGWSIGDHGDDYGRIDYDGSIFNIPSLASYVHSKGLKLGVYVLPGAFCSDSNKIILGTTILINATLSGNNNGFARCDFDFEKDGVQQWHDSVVALFASWGVDLIKLDYITPGSPDNGGNLPANNSGSVVAYHHAITASGRPMRLDISWKLERNATYFDIWSANADSMRTDQDINNSGQSTFVSWRTVQRAIDNYRDFISRIVEASENPVSTIYPDLDNLYVGNGEDITGVSDAMRETMATHWIGAAANLILGSDLTQLDALGKRLLTDPTAIKAAQFTARYPMQARNPGSGRNDSKQLQAWTAGPDEDGNALVVLANYGPDEGQGGFQTSFTGEQTATASWSDLGINGSYNVSNVWTGVSLGIMDDEISANLGPGESWLLNLALVRTRF